LKLQAASLEDILARIVSAIEIAHIVQRAAPSA
jgi:hypothetical protein